MFDSSKSTKSKSSGCAGCLSFLALGAATLMLQRCEFTSEYPIPDGQKIALEQEAKQVRSYFEEDRCGEFLEKFVDSNLKNDDFCSGRKVIYNKVQSVNFADSGCVVKRRLTAEEEDRKCHLNYQLTLANGESVLETFLWMVNEEKYKFIEISWKPQN